MPQVRALQVTQGVMVPLVTLMVAVLQVMPRFLGTVMGTSTHQDRSMDCWKSPAKGTASWLGVVMVRVL